MYFTLDFLDLYSDLSTIKVVKSICSELSINNVDAINDRVENHLDHYDFILSRAVTRMDKFYSIFI